jgi:hypothetical protein
MSKVDRTQVSKTDLGDGTVMISEEHFLDDGRVETYMFTAPAEVDQELIAQRRAAEIDERAAIAARPDVLLDMASRARATAASCIAEAEALEAKANTKGEVALDASLR